VKKTILLVDDYSPTRSLIAEALEQNEDYRVCEAGNGREAIDLLQIKPCDMVITDIMMPVMNGMELLQSLREKDIPIPVVMITSKPAVDLAVSAMKSGVVDFLEKPFDLDTLLLKVDLYLKDNESFALPHVQQGDVTLREEREQLSLKNYVFETVEKAVEDNDEIFTTIVELAVKIANGESGALLLYDRKYEKFYPKAQKGEDYGYYGANTITTLKDIFLEAITKKDAVMVHSDVDPFISPSLICAPLFIHRTVFGVLSIRRKRGSGIFTKNDLCQILSLAKRASLNLENKMLYDSIYDNMTDTLMALVSSIQVRDHYTEEHSSRVTDSVVKIAKKMNVSPVETETLRIAALLHDIGKIAIPDDILLKPAALTREEYETIKEHPVIGDEILSHIPLLDDERKIVRHHHERWDGKGYPDGLLGNEIPFLARITAVADSYDAMTSDRPYRKGLSLDNTIRELEKNRNTQFDPDVVDAFLEILSEENPSL
jgi:putative nucleotidyltransferase with HDIG domain